LQLDCEVKGKHGQLSAYISMWASHIGVAHGYRNQAIFWMTEELWFDSQQGQGYPLIPSIHDNTGPHLALYSMGTGAVSSIKQLEREAIRFHVVEV
jgi:hypothetical protein